MLWDINKITDRTLLLGLSKPRTQSSILKSFCLVGDYSEMVLHKRSISKNVVSFQKRSFKLMT